jgi:carbon-monoxide dehydrogenase medium subunit
MHDFEYEAPTSLGALTRLLCDYKERAQILAGGTDLIDHLRNGRLSPDVVVDVKKVPELTELTLTDTKLVIGGAVSCARIYEHAEIRKHFAALIDATRIIGGIQIQNRATLGGNLCNSSPAADSIPALIALKAKCVLAAVQSTEVVAVEDFCVGPGRNVMLRSASDIREGSARTTEVLSSIEIPMPAPRSGSHYRRFIPRNEMDIAVVGVGASVQISEDGTTFDGVRLALGAVAPTPLLVEEATDELVGSNIEDGIARAVDISRSVVSPIDDMRGTREFRTHVVGVLVERVLKEAVSRARQ